MSGTVVWAKALFDNHSEDAEELDFRRGDLVQVIEKDTEGIEGWWLCSLNGRRGIAPGNRLQIVEVQPPQSTAQSDEYAAPREENVVHRRFQEAMHILRTSVASLQSIEDYDRVDDELQDYDAPHDASNSAFVEDYDAPHEDYDHPQEDYDKPTEDYDQPQEDYGPTPNTRPESSLRGTLMMQSGCRSLGASMYRSCDSALSRDSACMLDSSLSLRSVEQSPSRELTDGVALRHILELATTLRLEMAKCSARLSELSAAFRMPILTNTQPIHKDLQLGNVKIRAFARQLSEAVQPLMERDDPSADRLRDALEKISQVQLAVDRSARSWEPHMRSSTPSSIGETDKLIKRLDEMPAIFHSLQMTLAEAVKDPTSSIIVDSSKPTVRPLPAVPGAPAPKGSGAVRRKVHRDPDDDGFDDDYENDSDDWLEYDYAESIGRGRDGAAIAFKRQWSIARASLDEVLKELRVTPEKSPQKVPAALVFGEQALVAGETIMRMYSARLNRHVRTEIDHAVTRLQLDLRHLADQGKQVDADELAASISAVGDCIRAMGPLLEKIA